MNNRYRCCFGLFILMIFIIIYYFKLFLPDRSILTFPSFFIPVLLHSPDRLILSQLRESAILSSPTPICAKGTAKSEFQHGASKALTFVTECTQHDHKTGSDVICASSFASPFNVREGSVASKGFKTQTLPHLLLSLFRAHIKRSHGINHPP